MNRSDGQIATVSDLDDLSRLRDEIVSTVEELEECLKHEVLHLPLGSEHIRNSLGPLVSIYENAKIQSDSRTQSCRDLWIQNSLREFSLALQDSNTNFPVLEMAQGSNLVVEFEGTRLPIRLDQALRGKFWGIGLVSADAKVRSELATCALTTALARLASCISTIGRMCQAVKRTLFAPEMIRWDVDNVGIMFEHLLVDILNEDQCRAKRATLLEDLFEWTDIRVKYEGLPRKRGARIQVKLSTSRNSIKPPTWMNAETHVVLALGPLADFIEEVWQGGRDDDSTDQLWESFGCKPADSVEVADVLRLVFTDAIRRNDNPLGPLIHVPAPTRKLIRLFVREASFRACERMTEHLSERPNTTPRWRRRL